MKELNQVLPILQEAESALDTLDQSKIDEAKKTAKPSANAEIVFKAVFILIEKQPKFQKIEWKDI